MRISVKLITPGSAELSLCV